MTLFWLALANLARWIGELAERHLDSHDRDPVTLVKEAWVNHRPRLTKDEQGSTFRMMNGRQR